MRYIFTSKLYLLEEGMSRKDPFLLLWLCLSLSTSIVYTIGGISGTTESFSFLCRFCLSDPVASVRCHLGREDHHRAGREGDDHRPRGPAGGRAVPLPAAQPWEQQSHLRHRGGSRTSAKAQTGVGWEWGTVGRGHMSGGGSHSRRVTPGEVTHQVGWYIQGELHMGGSHTR